MKVTTKHLAARLKKLAEQRAPPSRIRVNWDAIQGIEGADPSEGWDEFLRSLPEDKREAILADATSWADEIEAEINAFADLPSLPTKEEPNVSGCDPCV